jgi:hypothetical protein
MKLDGRKPETKKIMLLMKNEKNIVGNVIPQASEASAASKIRI